MMDRNFGLLLPRIVDSNNCIDYDKMIKVLKGIKNNCICIGVGGSQPVSLYASKILASKNDIITQNMEPRDVFYTNLKLYKSILAFTYGGDNYGIESALTETQKFKLKRYVFTSNDDKLKYTLDPKNDSIVNYHGNLEYEKSFISIASTLIPMSLLLRYYLDGSDQSFYKLICDLYIKNCTENSYEPELCESIKYYFSEEKTIHDNLNDIDYALVFGTNKSVEIMTGDNTYVSSRVIESNLVEAGLNVPIIHEKYNYCHGRSTLAFHHNHETLIYLINELKPKEIDMLLLKELKYLYKQIIVLKTSQKDKIVGEFELVLKAMFLSKKIAESRGEDLSKVDYAPAVKKLYRFKGEM